MTEKYTIPIIINGYREFIDQYLALGWKPYFLSFMFKPLKLSEGPMDWQMQDEIHRCYSILIKRFAKNLSSQYEIQRHFPRLLAFPDRPVPKREKKPLPDVTINGGLHYQGVLLTPPESRFKGDLLEFLRAHRAKFTKNRLRRLHAKEITSNCGYVVGYGMKSLMRKTVDYDDVLVLPRARSELPSGLAPMTREERQMKEIQSRWNLSKDAAARMVGEAAR